MLPFMVFGGFCLSSVAVAVLIGLAVSGVYWLFRIVEMLMLGRSLGFGSAISKRRSASFDRVRACGSFIFKWRLVILILIGMPIVACGGFIEWMFAEWHRDWEESEPVPMTWFEILICFTFGGLLFGTPPAIGVMFTFDCFFRLLRHWEKGLDPVVVGEHHQR